MAFTHAKAVQYSEIAQKIMNAKYTMKEISDEMQKICDVITPAHQIEDPNNPGESIDVEEVATMPEEYGVEIPVATKELRFTMYETRLRNVLTALQSLSMA